MKKCELCKCKALQFLQIRCKLVNISIRYFLKGEKLYGLQLLTLCMYIFGTFQILTRYKSDLTHFIGEELLGTIVNIHITVGFE